MDPLQLISRVPLPFLARCHVPEDLETVSSRGAETPARETGSDPAGVEQVWRAAKALYRTGVTPALQLCVRHRGEVVIDRCLGHARGNAPGEDPQSPTAALATPETPFCLFSASKLVTAMLIHKLDEQGLLHLEDRVADFVPGFERNGKQWITVRHLLSHRAGIPNIEGDAMDLDLLADPDRIHDMICEMKPATRAGRLVAYHAISGGFVLGEIVRNVTGADLRALADRELREPLGLHGLSYGAAEEDLDRVAVNARTGPLPPPPGRWLLKRALGRDLDAIVALSNDRRFLRGIIPSGNVVATARETSTFLQCLLDEGRHGDRQVFEPATVRHALSEQSYRSIDLTLFLPLRFGLGPMLGDDPVGVFGPDTGRAFGHLGFSNVFAWADPAREISVALLTSGKPVVSSHVVRLAQLLMAINRSFPRNDR